MLVSRCVLPAFLATLLGCSLPLEDKNACESAADCLDGRACVADRCTDEACTLACDALCGTRASCGLEPGCAPDACDDARDGFAGVALAPAQCGAQYDLLSAERCEAVTCFDACAVTCALGVDCALIDDADTCTLLCQQASACGPAAQACNELDAGVLACWSRGEPSGC